MQKSIGVIILKNLIMKNTIKKYYKKGIAGAYKLFSKLGETFIETDNKLADSNTLENTLPARGKRICAHDLFSTKTVDTIKEDGVFVH